MPKPEPEVTLNNIYGTNPDGSPRTLEQALEERRLKEELRLQKALEQIED